jgi:N-acetyl-anhydromuramyl-L-alanine amidase AmpD
VIAAGQAWHAGNSRHAGYTNLNDEFVGIEAESPGDGTWTAAQRDAYPKLVGSLLHVMKRDVSRYVSHRDCAIPAGRKPDPTGMTDTWMRTMARQHMDRLSGSAASGSGSLPQLDVGDTGDAVTKLQIFLSSRYRSYASDLVANGIYDAKMEEVIKEFQRRTFVDPVGRVGPLTNAALWKEGYRG